MLVAALVVVSLFPAPNEEVREQVRRIAEREDLQTSLSFDPQEPAAQPAEGRRGARESARQGGEPGARQRTPRRDRPDTTSSTGGGDGAWARTLLLVVGAALAVALVVALIVAARGPPSPTTGSGLTPAPAEPLATLPQSALGPAEGLAAEGRFEEAVHRLLLDALAALAAQSGLHLPRHLTSREVLATLRLTPAVNEALAVLVDLVEISRFGGRTLGGSDWRHASAAFTRLAGTGAPPA